MANPVEPAQSLPITPTSIAAAREDASSTKIEAERKKSEADKAAAKAEAERQKREADNAAAATSSACLKTPAFETTFLPSDFSNQLVPGSGGQITVGPDGSISPIEPVDPTVYHYAGPAGRYIDLRLGDDFGEKPATAEAIPVLGHEARFGAIEDGYSVQFSVVGRTCGSYTMLAYGVTEADARQVFAGLTLHA